MKIFKVEQTMFRGTTAETSTYHFVLARKFEDIPLEYKFRLVSWERTNYQQPRMKKLLQHFRSEVASKGWAIIARKW